MMDILESLRFSFNNHVAFREKRPGIVQVVAPLFHEDGDMIDLFLDLPREPSGLIRVTDHGLTLMRLSYSYDLDSPAKQKVFGRILSENCVTEHQGRLFVDSTPDGLYPALLQLAQTIAKVSNMQAFKKEVVQNLFYEMLGDFIQSTLARFRPQPHYLPVTERDDLEVDWRFDVLPRPMFLYGVMGDAKALRTAFACLELLRNQIPFRSVVVHEDFENGLSRKDKTSITSAADKQFISLGDFRANAEQYFRREAEPLLQ